MILVGDMRERLGELADGSVDAIVTDPPYHLSVGKRAAAGFMGQSWDGGDIAFQAATWASLLRVAKPGAHLVAFGGARTFHRIWCAVEDGGWEIRDTIMWLYGQGFPKSANQAGAWEGWGTALKPAFEPIVLARKPMSGPVAENLLQHGVGALNIDASRIGVVDREEYDANHSGDRGHAGTRTHEQRGATDFKPGGGSASAVGRWPANVAHDGSPEVVAAFPSEAGAVSPVCGDEPSSVTKDVFGARGRVPGAFHGDTGSAARFFWCPKATRTDRNDGLDGMDRRPLNWSSGEESPGTFQSEGTEREVENYHPTVKPTELMRYLCRLIAPRGALVLDPFAGSGSTGRAAVLEGMRFVGIELDAGYAEIARRRIEEVSRQGLLF